MRRPEGFDPGGDEAHKGSRPPRSAAPSRQTSAPKPKNDVPSANVSHADSSGTANRTRGRLPRDSAARAARAAVRHRRRAEIEEVRRFTRRSRHRRLVWIISGATVILLLALIAIAVWSPLLALREIRVTGTAAVNPDDVVAAAGTQLGTPLALLDDDALRNSLSQFPLIQSYSTELLPPGTWVIHITERSAIGVTEQQDGFISVDPVGVPIQTFDVVPDDLPLLTVPDATAGHAAFDSVIAVLRALPEPLRAEVQEVRANTEDDVTLVLRGVGARVRWGSADRSAMKARVFETLRQNQGADAAVEYDVTTPLHVVVRPL